MIPDSFLNNFVKKLETNNIKIIKIDDINYGKRFLVEKGKDYISSENINKSESLFFNIYYSSKKGYSIVFQNKYKNSSFVEKIQKIFNEFVYFKDDVLFTIGADEAGKGDFFGPLVISAVYIDDKFLDKIYSLRLKESKLSNDNLLLKFYNKIRKDKNNYEIKIIFPEDLNDLIKEKKNIGENLNNILDESYYEIITKLIEKNISSYKDNKIKTVIIDKFGKVKKINLLKNDFSNINLKVEPKAEKYLSVLVASILAKAVYIEELNKIRNKYKIDFKKGASNKVLEQRKLFIEKYSETNLKKIAKVFFNFKNKVE